MSRCSNGYWKKLTISIMYQWELVSALHRPVLQRKFFEYRKNCWDQFIWSQNWLDKHAIWPMISRQTWLRCPSCECTCIHLFILPIRHAFLLEMINNWNINKTIFDFFRGIFCAYIIFVLIATLVHLNFFDFIGKFSGNSMNRSEQDLTKGKDQSNKSVIKL